MLQYSRAQRVFEQAATVESDFDVAARKTDGVDHRQNRCNQFRFGGNRRLTVDIHVPLEVFSLAAPGHAFVAPVLADREPPDRKAQAAGTRHHHPGDGGRHFRPQGQVPVVDLKVIELVDDFFAGLAHEEFCVLDDRGVDLLEGEFVRRVAEVAKQPLSKAMIFRVEVSGSPRRLQVLFAHCR